MLHSRYFLSPSCVQCWYICKDISVSSVEFTPWVLEHILLQSDLLWGQTLEHFSAAIANYYSSSFPIPPHAHQCWVGRGRMELKVYLTFLYMSSIGNETPDVPVLSGIHLATHSSNELSDNRSLPVIKAQGDKNHILLRHK